MEEGTILQLHVDINEGVKKMDKVLGFQLSILGSFQNIQPNLVMTQRVVQVIGEEGFIPATLEVNIVDPQSKAVISDTRFQMVSQDQAWAVMFFAERIDINYEYKGGEHYYSDIPSVMQRAKDVCGKVFSAFADTTSIRLAVNARISLKEMNVEEKQGFIKRFAIVPDTFEGSPVTEWSTRFNAPTEMSFGDKTCLCNRIVEIFEFVGIDTVHNIVKPGVGVSLDINTDQNNTMLIYKYSDLLAFTDAVYPFIEGIIKEIGGVV